VLAQELNAPTRTFKESDAKRAPVFGLSGRIWIEPEQSSCGAVHAQFVEAVKERFDLEGLDMPYPNTELSGGVEITNVGQVENDGR
jgi:hypothetical protein